MSGTLSLAEVVLTGSNKCEESLVHVQNEAHLQSSLCTFKDNSLTNTGSQGAAVQLESGATYTTDSSSYTHLSVFGNGGAVLAAKDSVIKAQAASHSFGGAVYAFGALSVSFIGCRFTHTVAIQGGGAVDLCCATRVVAVNRSQFVDTQSPQGSGGAVKIGHSSFSTIENSGFKNTAAGAFGAAVYAGEMTILNISNTSFVGHTSLMSMNGVIGAWENCTFDQEMRVQFIAVATNVTVALLWTNISSSATTIASLGLNSTVELQNSNLSCIQGQEILNTSNTAMQTYSCGRCSSGFFNAFGGFLTTLQPQHSCVPCPQHANCSTGVSAVPNKHYSVHWANDRAETTVCPNSKACPGDGVYCAKGYDRPDLGCGQCKAGFGAAVDPFLCYECPKREWTKYIFLGLYHSFAQVMGLLSVRSLATKEGSLFSSQLKIIMAWGTSMSTLMHVQWSDGYALSFFSAIVAMSASGSPPSAAWSDSVSDCLYGLHGNITILQHGVSNSGSGLSFRSSCTPCGNMVIRDWERYCASPAWTPTPASVGCCLAQPAQHVVSHSIHNFSQNNWVLLYVCSMWCCWWCRKVHVRCPRRLQLCFHYHRHWCATHACNTHHHLRSCL